MKNFELSPGNAPYKVAVFVPEIKVLNKIK